MPETTDMQAVINVARESAEPVQLEPGKIYLITERDGTQTIADTIVHSDHPFRERRTVSVDDAAAFIAYTLPWREDTHSATGANGDGFEFWRSEDKMQILAVLNPPSVDEPGWCDHRVTLSLRQTPEWQRWEGISGKLVSQEEFAQFIEDNLADIAAPDAGALLELVQTFRATIKANFSSAAYLASGARSFRYEEDVKASGGRKDNLVIPSEITLGIQPFVGARQFAVAARFRYRLANGDLQLGVRLNRPEDVTRAAFVDVCSEVEKETGVQLWNGWPS